MRLTTSVSPYLDVPEGHTPSQVVFRLSEVDAKAESGGGDQA